MLKSTKVDLPHLPTKSISKMDCSNSRRVSPQDLSLFENTNKSIDDLVHHILEPREKVSRSLINIKASGGEANLS